MGNDVAYSVTQARVFSVKSDEDCKISILLNSLDYFLTSVHIEKYRGNFRLVVMHNGRLLIDEVYKTARGSKIAFYRYCKYRLWKDGVKPRWSPFYNPDDEAIDETCRPVKKMTFY